MDTRVIKDGTSFTLSTPNYVKFLVLIPCIIGGYTIVHCAFQNDHDALAVMSLFYLPFLLFVNPLLLFKKIEYDNESIQISQFGIWRKRIHTSIKDVQSGYFQSKVMVGENGSRVRFSTYAILKLKG